MEKPASAQDATAVAALKRAGVVLIGTLNMDEYAYGFVTENTHYGPTHNPHDLTCIAGGFVRWFSCCGCSCCWTLGSIQTAQSLRLLPCAVCLD